MENAIEIINGEKYVLDYQQNNSAPCSRCIFLKRPELICNHPNQYYKNCKILPGTKNGWNTYEYRKYKEEYDNNYRLITEIMSNNIFSAKEAKEMLKHHTDNLLNQQLSDICFIIKERINNGFDYVVIDIDKIEKFNATSPKLENRLHELGYKVEYHTSQKDGDYLRIEWK